MTELEEEKRCQSQMGRDEAHVEAKRLQRKLDRLQSELRVTKQSNTDLRTQLCLTDELKVEGTRVRPQSRSRGMSVS